MDKLKTPEELEDELCDYCPLPKGSNHMRCHGGEPYCCEGSHCKEAYENYVEQYEERE